MFRRDFPDDHMQVVFNTDFSDQDLYVREIGHSRTRADIAKGPWLRESYILHFVHSGQGLFNGTPVRAGEGFLIAPNEIHALQSDKTNPWEHCWIMFDGARAKQVLEHTRLAPHNQVFAGGSAEQAYDLLSEVIEQEHPDVCFSYYLLGILYRILAWQGAATPYGRMIPGYRSRYVQQAVKYMQVNYYREITVEDIASSVNLSSKYLCKLFKSSVGCSPQGYLIRLRVSRAEELLSLPDLGIGEIARSVGYANVLYFSQVFRKHRGRTPSEQRRLAGGSG